jgi:hypothetical protein
MKKIIWRGKIQQIIAKTSQPVMLRTSEKQKQKEIIE